MKTDKAWQIWGDKEPYYAVLTSEKYLAGNLNDGDLEEFFSRGEEHLSSTLATIRKHIDPDFSPTRAVDFGCGTGRVLVPLAGCCESVIGVDVSDGMLREAARSCEARAQARNWRLVSTAEFIDDSDVRYDFLHSHIVFQHIRPRDGERLLRLLLGKLDPGGVFAMQFVHRSTVHPLRRGLTWLKNRLPFGQNFSRALTGRGHLVAPMEMNVYNLQRLIEVFADAGAPNLYVQTSRHDALDRVVIYGRKQGPGGSL
jgi:SAM-dependent methyltransferase